MFMGVHCEINVNRSHSPLNLNSWPTSNPVLLAQVVVNLQFCVHKVLGMNVWYWVSVQQLFEQKRQFSIMSNFGIGVRRYRYLEKPKSNHLVSTLNYWKPIAISVPKLSLNNSFGSVFILISPQIRYRDLQYR